MPLHLIVRIDGQSATGMAQHLVNSTTIHASWTRIAGMAAAAEGVITLIVTSGPQSSV